MRRIKTKELLKTLQALEKIGLGAAAGAGAASLLPTDEAEAITLGPKGIGRLVEKGRTLEELKKAFPRFPRGVVPSMDWDQVVKQPSLLDDVLPPDNLANRAFREAYPELLQSTVAHIPLKNASRGASYDLTPDTMEKYGTFASATDEPVMHHELQHMVKSTEDASEALPLDAYLPIFNQEALKDIPPIFGVSGDMFRRKVAEEAGKRSPQLKGLLWQAERAIESYQEAWRKLPKETQEELRRFQKLSNLSAIDTDVGGLKGKAAREVLASTNPSQEMQRILANHPDFAKAYMAVDAIAGDMKATNDMILNEMKVEHGRSWANTWLYLNNPEERLARQAHYDKDPVDYKNYTRGFISALKADSLPVYKGELSHPLLHLRQQIRTGKLLGAMAAGAGAGAGVSLLPSEAKAESVEDLLYDTALYGKTGRLPEPPPTPRAQDPLYMPKHNEGRPAEQRMQEIKQSWIGEMQKAAENQLDPVLGTALALKGGSDVLGWIEDQRQKIRFNTPLITKGAMWAAGKLGELNEAIERSEEGRPKPEVTPSMLTASPFAAYNLLSPSEGKALRENVARGLATPLKAVSFTLMKDFYDKYFSEVPERRHNELMEAAFPDAIMYPGTILDQMQWMVGYTALFKGFSSLRAAKTGVGWFGKNNLFEAGKGSRALWEMAAVGIPADMLTGGSVAGSLLFNVGVPFMAAGAISKPVIKGAKAIFGPALAEGWKQLSKTLVAGMEKIPVQGVVAGKHRQFLGESGERTLAQLFLVPGKRLWKYLPDEQKKIETLVRTMHQAKQEGRLSSATIEKATGDEAFNAVLSDMLTTSPREWKKLGIDLDVMRQSDRDALLEAYNVIDFNRHLPTGFRATQTIHSTTEGKQTVWFGKGKAQQEIYTKLNAQKNAVEWMRSEEGGVKFLGFRPAETQAIDVKAGQERLLPVWGYVDEDGKAKVFTFSNKDTLADLNQGKMNEEIAFLEKLATAKGQTVKEFLAEPGRYAHDVRIQDQIARTYLNWDIYMNNYDTYMARIFTKHWNDLPKDIQNKYILFKSQVEAFEQMSTMDMMATSMSRFMYKNDLPEELVRALTPIVDMSALNFAQYVTTKSDLLIADAFRSMAASDKIALDVKQMEDLMKAGKARDLLDVQIGKASSTLPAMHKGSTSTVIVNRDGVDHQFIKIPDNTDKYGMLAGKWLQQDAFFELETMVLPSGARDSLSSKALTWWKFGATVLNPKTHWRNTFSNVMLNHLASNHGMSVYDPRSWHMYKEAVKVLSRPEKYRELYKELNANGLTLGTFTQSELKYFEPILRMKHEKGLQGALEAMNYGRKWVGRSAASLYQMEESWAKVAKYMYLRKYKPHVSAEEAARAAMESTFDYSAVSPFIHKWRSSWLGAPFITFSYKALPLIAKGLVTAPWRMMSLQTGLFAAQMAAVAKTGITPEELEQLKAKLPAAVASGKFLLLPWRDKRGRLQWLDLTYILPYGDVLGMSGGMKDVMGAKVPGVGKYFLANPFLAVAGSIMKNSDYNGQPLWDKDQDSTATVAGKLLLGTAQMALPAVTAPALDLYKTINDAKSGRTDAQWAAANLFGLKVNPFEPEEIDRRWRSKLLKEQRTVKSKAIGKIAQYPDNQAMEDKARKEYTKKMLKIREKVERAENPPTLTNIAYKKLWKRFVNPKSPAP